MKFVYLLIGSALLVLIMDSYHPGSRVTTDVGEWSQPLSAPAPPVVPPADGCGCAALLRARNHAAFLDCENAEHIDLLSYVDAKARRGEVADTTALIESRMEHVTAMLAAVRDSPCPDMALCYKALAVLTEHFTGAREIIALIEHRQPAPKKPK